MFWWPAAIEKISKASQIPSNSTFKLAFHYGDKIFLLVAEEIIQWADHTNSHVGMVSPC